jgi:hypothetical protein
VSDPIVIRIVRPFSNVEEYLDAESGTIDRRGMLLVDADALPPDTLVRFIVSLASGEALVKAEGRVKKHVVADGSSPGGLMVRFKRFGGVTKEFIDRAVRHRVASHRPPPADAEVESSRQPAQVTDAELSTPDAGPPPPPPTEVLEDAATDQGEISGVRDRPIDAVQAPRNRDELLEKLRERARQMTEAKLASFTKRAKVS